MDYLAHMARVVVLLREILHSQISQLENSLPGTDLLVHDVCQIIGRGALSATAQLHPKCLAFFSPKNYGRGLFAAALVFRYICRYWQ